MLKKLFKAKPSYHWNIIEKETVDEVIFRTSKPRNRLILELMARGGMRISEVLKPTPSDIHDRRLTLRSPKSAREQEFIFIPQRLADRLKNYIREKDIQPNQRIFPICYEAAREMVAKAGSVVGIHLRPHDLRRHAATYKSLRCAHRNRLEGHIATFESFNNREIFWQDQRCRSFEMD